MITITKGSPSRQICPIDFCCTIPIRNSGMMSAMDTPEKRSLIRYEVVQMNSAAQNQSRGRERFVSPLILPTLRPLSNAWLQTSKHYWRPWFEKKRATNSRLLLVSLLQVKTYKQTDNGKETARRNASMYVLHGSKGKPEFDLIFSSFICSLRRPIV